MHELAQRETQEHGMPTQSVEHDLSTKHGVWWIRSLFTAANQFPLLGIRIQRTRSGLTEWPKCLTQTARRAQSC